MNFLKKLLNVILIIIGIVLIAFCADLLLNKTVKTSYNELSDVDQKAIGQIGDIINLFDKEDGNEDIWNSDYNPADNSYIITRTYGAVKGTSYVINMDLSGDFFAQKIEMPSEYSDILVFRLACSAPDTISLYSPSNDGTALVVNGEEIYSLKYSSTTVSHSGSGSFEESCIKGSFESEVQTADTPTVEVEQDFSLTDENVALTGLQYRIIDDLRDAEDIEEINELITEYVLVRDYQLKSSSDLALQQEKIELVQGCPLYVLYSVSDELGHGLTYFNRTKPNDIDFYSAFYYVCTGQYQNDPKEYFTGLGNAYVGAALCEILNDKRIVPGWNELLDKSTDDNFISQYSLIKDYCERACGKYSEKTLEDVQREYNYEEILNLSKTLIGGVSGD